ncbi:MAG: hypothetical protein DHS20C13_04100 [Thermodesulfobacteriota bacterium]|nr:MAG: hypothetical protein DHS20C13_04100 [Thermodesulfobacteriota bacterium]
MRRKSFIITFITLVVSGLLFFPGCKSDESGPYSDGKGWNNEEGFSFKLLNVPVDGKTGFTSLTSEQTGITFRNTLKDEQSTSNRIRNNGSGVAAGDIDNDGLADIYFSSLDGPNVLYKNLGGWKFKDVTSEAGADIALAQQFSTGATFADVDGDYDQDLIVGGLGNGVKLFLNEGNGKFKNITGSAGLNNEYGTHSVALADIDGDGDLDLYTANYRAETIKDQATELTLEMVDGKLSIPDELKDRIVIVDGKLKEYGEPDFLYINDGNGNFTPLSWTDGTFVDEDGKNLSGPPLDWGLSAILQDMDKDGDPDIYVCNDFWSPERVWINDGSGKFRAIDKVALRNTSATSMGVDVSDIDRDGDYDFFVVDMLSRDHRLRKMQMGTMKPTPASIGEIDNRPQIMRNTLFLNRGDNTYAEIANLSGLEDSEWSWAPVFFDIDLDGYEDLFVTNGHARDVQDTDTINHIRSLKLEDAEAQRQALLLYPRLETKNLAYRNMGDLRFEEVSSEWGLDLKAISHGAALADLDNDGDLDLVLNNLESPASIYRNDSIQPRVSVRLKGLSPNTYGIGAQVKILGGPVEQSKEVISGGKYLSSSDPVVTFATGDSKDDMTIEVTWRSGKKSFIENVKPNHIYLIDEKYAEDSKPIEPVVAEPFFEDVSNLINHSHHEEEFDDFKLQSLLPNRLSQLGPGIAWHDLNQDGNEDLIISSGKGGKLSIYINNDNGEFSPLDPQSNIETKLDQTSVVAWSNDVDSSSIIIGFSNFEDHKSPSPSALNYYYKKGSINIADALPGKESSTGPIAMADIDGDNDLDLFVGGRTIPGRYPEPVSSMLYINSKGKFEVDLNNSAKFKLLGMVSGAVFSDLNGDGFPELVLATEWGPVRVFKNDKGHYTDATENLGLAEYNGWWNGVTTGDLDGDGRMDIVATNWGLNHKYHLDDEHPLYIYYKDFNQDGTLDIVEAHYNETMADIVPERGLSCSSNAMPFIKTKIETYEQFGSAGIEDIYGEEVEKSDVVTANTLDHMVFLNRGNDFEAISLPIEAQFAPSFGVGVADYNGDGHEDVFIAQNFFASQIETPRIDAGRGLILKGDGKGGLVSIPGQDSGIKVYGDSRGSAFGDFDNDGRIDLAVTQNGAQTKLYQNIKAEPGLRIRLAGPKENPEGIGAQIRLSNGDSFGPSREIHSGSGYWSQDSSVQLMKSPVNPSQISVMWPGGATTLSDIPNGAKEIKVSIDGSVNVIR